MKYVFLFYPNQKNFLFKLILTQNNHQSFFIKKIFKKILLGKN